MLGEIIDGRGDGSGHLALRNFRGPPRYCYRVASAVGLVSIEIFGYRNPACREYAIELGLALQSQILRRGEGSRQGRVYLPREDMARFGLYRRRLAARTTTIDSLG